MSRAAFLLTVLWCAGPVAQAQDRTFCAGDSVYTDSWEAMGTRFRLQLVATDRVEAESRFELAREEVDRVDRLLSDYRSDSEWSRLHRVRSVIVDPETFGLLTRVSRLVEATDGAFDPSVGAIVDAWGFRSRHFTVPADTTLARLLAASGWHRTRLDSASRRVTLPPEPYRLDPGAFGKGYAADTVTDLLLRSGTNCLLVDAGGSTFRATAPPPGRAGWPVRLPGVDSRDVTVDLAHGALSTSGTAARSFVADGRTYGHVIDPRTGRPVDTRPPVHARMPTAFDADALSTALYVVGPAGADRLLDRFPGAEAWLGDGRVIRNPDP